MRPRGLLAATALFVLLVSSVSDVQSQDSSRWVIETVDRGDRFLGISLALDVAGHPHIGYNRGGDYYYRDEGELRYAYFDGIAWVTETLDSRVNIYLSLALDRSGRPSISYYSDGLKFAQYDGIDWRIEVVERGAYMGLFSSLTIDAYERPHISYNDESSHVLKYATLAGTTWVTETVDTGNAGERNIIAVDAVNRPHIGYLFNSSLRYAYYNGPAWQIRTVHSSWGGAFDLALDGASQPHFAYQVIHQRTPSEGDGELIYAYYDGSNWQAQVVASGPLPCGEYPSLALDANNRPHISYLDSAGSTTFLKYAYYDGRTWRIETVDSNLGRWIGYTSLALDASGRPHVSYYDDIGYSLKYAYLRPGAPLPSTGTSPGPLGLFVGAIMLIVLGLVLRTMIQKRPYHKS